MTVKDKVKRLMQIILTIGESELDVLLLVAEGAQRGQEVYGPLADKLQSGERDFVREALEEMRDGLFYLSAEMVRIAAMRRQ